MTSDTLIVEIKKINESRELRGVRPIPPELAQRFRQIQYAFSQGYQAAITTDELETIVFKMNIIEAEYRGFAYEGVGCALAQRDILKPSQQSIVEIFINSHEAIYQNYVYVGVGLMLGRQRLPLKPYLELLNPAKIWLVIDGYGFQYGMTHWQDSLEKQAILEELSGYACRVFDQGMGRSIWFLDGADVIRISKTIGAFPPERQVDLWSGLGYACCFAGGADQATLEALGAAAGSYKSILAQSVALATKSRQQLGHSSIYAERACEVLCGMGVKEASDSVDTIVERAPNNGAITDQEDWQHYRIRLMRSSKTVVTV